MAESLQKNAPAATRIKIIQRLSSDTRAIRDLRVRRLSLFGSFARDEAALASDVDLLVEFEAGRKSFDRLLDLGDLLEARLGQRVELVTTEALSPYLGPHIQTEAQDVPLDP